MLNHYIEPTRFSLTIADLAIVKLIGLDTDQSLTVEDRQVEVDLDRKTTLVLRVQSVR